MSVICTCPRDQLCDSCVDQQLTWMRGIATDRGVRWAESVARQRPDLLGRAWPELAGKALEMAVSKLAGLTADVRVLEGLLVHLQRGASRQWATLRAERDY